MVPLVKIAGLAGAKIICAAKRAIPSLQRYCTRTGVDSDVEAVNDSILTLVVNLT
jgi:hypothetical protein